MEDELLSDILAAEREISRQIDALEQQTAARLESVRQELARKVEEETLSLQAELEKNLSSARQKAEAASAALLAEAQNYAIRLKDIENAQLDRVLLHSLTRIRPEGCDDRKNEQT
jgi:vacuolar-type H+-ATPase subunit H